MTLTAPEAATGTPGGAVGRIARVERVHLVSFPLADGEHDDRHLRPAAKTADDLDSVDRRQAEIHDDEIWVLPRGERERLLPGRSEVDVVVPRAEVG